MPFDTSLSGTRAIPYMPFLTRMCMAKLPVMQSMPILLYSIVKLLSTGFSRFFQQYLRHLRYLFQGLWIYSFLGKDMHEQAVRNVCRTRCFPFKMCAVQDVCQESKEFIKLILAMFLGQGKEVHLQVACHS